LIHTIKAYEVGNIVPKPQKHIEATYCTKIEKENGLINWEDSAIKIYHKWQAYTPWPGIFTVYTGKRLLLEKIGTMNQDT
jgi:methionyl-tRNA formyltransferase